MVFVRAIILNDATIDLRTWREETFHDDDAMMNRDEHEEHEICCSPDELIH